MNRDGRKICFILLPGFSPDNIPVLGLKNILENKAYDVIASNFYGDADVTDFSILRDNDCIENVSKIINKASDDYDEIFGIGVSLGGAFLLEHAKSFNNLSGIVSIGTPFRLKFKTLLHLGQKSLPFVYPPCNLSSKQYFTYQCP